MGIAGGKIDATNQQNVFELLQEDRPNLEKYNQIAKKIVEINSEVDFSIDKKIFINFNLDNNLNFDKNKNTNKNLVYLLMIVKDSLMGYIREINLLTSDETYENESFISNPSLIQIQINNLVSCITNLLGYVAKEDLWESFEGNTPIAMNLCEACCVLLFGHKYTVMCDRSKPSPESPVNMNQQTLWKKPDNAFEELSNDYLMLIKNRTKILELVILLFRKSEKERKIYESEGNGNESEKEKEISKKLTQEKEISKEITQKKKEISKEITQEKEICKEITQEKEISKEITQLKEITQEKEILMKKEIRKEKEIPKEGNCAINLFSHRLSKNIFNTLYSCLTIIYSDSTVLINTNFYGILKNYKKACVKVLGAILANSLFGLGDSQEDQLIIQYYKEKMGILKLNSDSDKFSDKFSKELLKECEEPMKYSLLLLSSFGLESIEAFFYYFFQIFHHYNMYFYNKIKSKIQEQNEFLYDADSGYLLNLAYISYLFLKLNPSSTTFRTSQLLCSLFEEIIFYLLYQNEDGNGIKNGNENSNLNENGNLIENENGSHSIYINTNQSQKGNEAFILLLYSVLLEISSLRDTSIHLCCNSNIFRDKLKNLVPLPKYNSSIDILIKILNQIIKGKAPKNSSYIQVISAIFFNISPFVKDISKTSSIRLINILLAVTEEKAWQQKGLEFQRSSYLIIFSITRCLIFHMDYNSYLISELINHQDLCNKIISITKSDILYSINKTNNLNNLNNLNNINNINQISDIKKINDINIEEEIKTAKNGIELPSNTEIEGKNKDHSSADLNLTNRKTFEICFNLYVYYRLDQNVVSIFLSDQVNSEEIDSLFMKENCEISVNVFSQLQNVVIPAFNTWNNLYGIKSRKNEENIFEYLINTSLIDLIPCDITLKKFKILKNTGFDKIIAKKIIQSLLSSHP